VMTNIRVSVGLWTSVWFFVLCSADSFACDVPVFRWALERWWPDPYQVIVFHRGPLGAEDQATLDRLKASATDAAAPANVAVISLDLAEEHNDAVDTLWRSQSSPVLPWMVVRYPGTRGAEEYLWSSRFSEQAVNAWLYSPIRRELARRLAEGESAVWLLLEIGDPKKDNAAAELIERHTKELEDILYIPSTIVDSPYGGWDDSGATDLRVEFSLMKVSRNDPKEQMLVHMLEGSEPDLKDFDEPMAFPVYGRGRALFALVGAGINEQNITDACAFLVAGCSCQIKGFNPGTDLLIAVDWDGAISDAFVKPVELPPLPGIAEMTPAPVAEGPETTDGSGTAGGEMNDPGRKLLSPVVRNVMMVAAGLVVLMAAATAFLTNRTERGTTNQ